MNKYKIIALFGPAGAGKDYIQKKIMETQFGKDNLHEIISCTTRPPREGEIDGVHYHFIPTAAQFLHGEKSNTWLEFTNFNGWWYGTSTDHLVKDKINIGVFNMDGIEQLVANREVQCVPVYIKVSDKTRLLRQLNRENSPDCKEIIRRFLTDEKDFSKLHEKRFSYFVIDNNTEEFIPIENEIYYLVKGYNWS